MHRQRDISNFFITGINYKKTDAAIRGLYAIGEKQYTSILSYASQYGAKELFVLSTCNRTEIYGFAEDASRLIELLCTQTEGSLASFKEMAYTMRGREAIEHLFNVAAGLDSQILGDYEIVGQIKQAARFSKENKCIDAYLDRLINAVLQSSKEIKSTTGLSGGTVSVSFAAVQYIREHITGIEDKNILLLGTGKIGRNTCKNLVDYLGTTNITLINRTEEKATALAMELGVRVASLSEMPERIEAADIILVATNSQEPIILKSHLSSHHQKLIIDLSIPYNVETEAQQLPGITLVNVDDLSKIKDETFHKREAEVPLARAIIANHIDEFLEWHQMRRYVPLFKTVKSKLEDLHSCHLYISYSSRNTSALTYSKKDNIQKVINGMAVKMREQNQQGCYYIEAINEYIATGTV
jgi:glutamyl-tRNA reductase